MTEAPAEEGGELVVPSNDAPVSVGGAVVGPAIIPRQRQVKLIRPRRWRRAEASRVHDIWFLECPYCLALVVDEPTGDEHLFRLHANNTRERPGQFDLIPWLTELQRQVDELTEDLIEPETWHRGVDDSPMHTWRDRKRRKVHWRSR